MKKRIIMTIMMIVGSLNVISFIGCSGMGNTGPTVHSIAQYQAGEFDPGWFKDMTPDEAKEFVDGQLDSKARELGQKYWEQQYGSHKQESNVVTETSSSNVQTTEVNSETQNYISDDVVGKTIIQNASSLNNVQIGVDGPISTFWILNAHQKIYDILVPGDYITWIDDGNGKTYSVYSFDIFDPITKKCIHKKGEFVVMNVGIAKKTIGKEKANAVLNYTNQRHP